MKIRDPAKTMHAFPCSGLLTCFGHERETVAFEQTGTNTLDVQKSDASSVVLKQPCGPVSCGHNKKADPIPEGDVIRCCFPERNGVKNGSIRAPSCSHSKLSDSNATLGPKPETDFVSIHTHIPRPTIITVPTVSVLVWQSLIFKSMGF